MSPSPSPEIVLIDLLHYHYQSFIFIQPYLIRGHLCTRNMEYRYRNIFFFTKEMCNKCLL